MLKREYSRQEWAQFGLADALWKSAQRNPWDLNILILSAVPREGQRMEPLLEQYLNIGNPRFSGCSARWKTSVDQTWLISHYSSKELVDLTGGQDWLYQLIELLSPGGNTADKS